MSDNAVTTTTGDQSTAVAYTGSFDPYADAARQENVDSDGAYMSFSGKTGGFTAGAKKEEVPLGTQFAACMPEYKRGWICWVDGKNVDEEMKRVIDGSPLEESELTDHGPYEKHDDGSEDGWQRQASIVFKAVNGSNEQYIFNTSSVSGLKALGRLSKAYSIGGKLKIDDNGITMIPIVEVDQDSFEHKIKKIGTIYTPSFEIVDWVSEEELASYADGENPEDYEPEEDEKPAEKPAPKTVRRGKKSRFG